MTRSFRPHVLREYSLVADGQRGALVGPAALYTEEYDVHQRQLRGNLPQAFVHAGLLETAARLSVSS